MYRPSDVRSIEIELSSECNARCPRCERNLFGYPYNKGYPEQSLTLEQVQKILPPALLSQIEFFYVNGNFGDILMNPEAVAIAEYVRAHVPPSCYMVAGTNGGARDRKFWQGLAKSFNRIIFCIDGLEDTHSIYRKNTAWSTVIQNAKTVIEAGGSAAWKMIEFEHNRHQIQQARQLSQELGFAEFFTDNHGRESSFVYDRDGNFERTIGTWSEPVEKTIYPVIKFMQQEATPRPELHSGAVSASISCKSQKSKRLYITATGDVYPCCFMGFYPQTFVRKTDLHYGRVNHQLREIVQENNAIEHGIEHAMSWFDRVPERWQRESWAQGRLIVCNDACGENSPYSDFV